MCFAYGSPCGACRRDAHLLDGTSCSGEIARRASVFRLAASSVQVIGLIPVWRRASMARRHDKTSPLSFEALCGEAGCGGARQTDCLGRRWACARARISMSPQVLVR